MIRKKLIKDIKKIVILVISLIMLAVTGIPSSAAMLMDEYGIESVVGDECEANGLEQFNDAEELDTSETTNRHMCHE